MRVYLFWVDNDPSEDYGVRFAMVIAKTEALARERLADKGLTTRREAELLRAEEVSSNTPIITCSYE
jgi:hypothetical protein